VKWPQIIFVVVVLALADWAWIALHPSPERVIRRQLDGIAKAASFGPNQGALAKLRGADKLTEFFSTNVEVSIDVPGQSAHHLMGREEIQQAAIAARGSVQSLSVTFPDVSIVVNSDKESAVADLTLQARVAGEQDMIVQEMKMTFRNIDGDWLVAKVETVRTLH
jgi:hypothetical protein